MLHFMRKRVAACRSTKRWPESFKRVGSLTALLAVELVGQISISRLATPVYGQDASVTEQRCEELRIDVPANWLRQDDVAADEGHWRWSDRGQVDAWLLRDRTVDEFLDGAIIESRVQAMLLGRPALLVEGLRLTDQRPQRFRLLIHEPVNADVQLALHVVADPAAASKSHDQVAKFLSSIRSDQPLPPRTIEPSDNDPGARNEPTSIDQVHAPDSTATAGPLGGVSEISSVYRHARGGFELTLPEGWSVSHGRSLHEVDADFDTLWNSRRELAVVVARISDPATDANAALQRWIEMRTRGLKGMDQLASKLEAVAGVPTAIVSYQEPYSGPRVWRLSMASGGFRYPLSVYEVGSVQSALAELPAEAGVLLDSLQMFDRSEILKSESAVEINGTRITPPRDWIQVDDPTRFSTDRSIEAMWIEKRETGAGRISLATTSPNVSPFPNVDRVQWIGIRRTAAGPVWMAFGVRRLPATAVLVAAFPHGPTDSQRSILTLETPIERWDEQESLFRSLVDSVRFRGGARVEPLEAPPWSRAYSVHETLAELTGEHRFKAICRPEGVEFQELESRERCFVPVGNANNVSMDPTVAELLLSEPSLLGRLGEPLGETVSLFDDTLRVQLFRKGVFVLEPASRSNWYSVHAERPRS